MVARADPPGCCGLEHQRRNGCEDDRTDTARQYLRPCSGGQLPLARLDPRGPKRHLRRYPPVALIPRHTRVYPACGRARAVSRVGSHCRPKNAGGDVKIVALIPARMGSSRFPGKPLAPLLGKPMIGHVYERVTRNPLLTVTAVATCDHEIFDYIQSIGGRAIMTGAHHERASDRCAEALGILEEEDR